MVKHTAAKILAAYFFSQGIFSRPSENKQWPLFTNTMPELPLEAACIYDTIGFMDGREFTGGRTIEHPGFQIRFRTNQVARVDVKGAQVKNALDAIQMTTVSLEGVNYKIHAAKRTSSIIPLMTEEGGGRLIFVVNGLITFTEA